MTYLATQLPSGRWGIYAGKRLLATIGNQQTLKLILAQLPDAKVLTAESVQHSSAG